MLNGKIKKPLDHLSHKNPDEVVAPIAGVVIWDGQSIGRCKAEPSKAAELMKRLHHFTIGHIKPGSGDLATINLDTGQIESVSLIVGVDLLQDGVKTGARYVDI